MVSINECVSVTFHYNEVIGASGSFTIKPMQSPVKSFICEVKFNLQAPNYSLILQMREKGVSHDPFNSWSSQSQVILNTFRRITKNTV